MDPKFWNDPEVTSDPVEWLPSRTYAAVVVGSNASRGGGGSDPTRRKRLATLDALR